MSEKHRTPPKLGPAGRALYRRLDDQFEFDPGELVRLELACRQADDVSRLEASIAKDGITVLGASGQTRVNPALAEVRQGRQALSRLIGALSLPDETGRATTASSRQAQKAADLRWSRIERRSSDG